MFDVDEHPNLDDAIVMARDNSINLAISNPCLELWFLLHFKDQTAAIHRHDLQKSVASILECDKTLTAKALDMLMDQHEQARERAKQLDEKHRGDGSPAGSNPSTGVWRLVDSIVNA